MDALGWLGIIVGAWLALSVPMGLLAAGLIKHGHDGEP
jgi:hypothetical protein